MTTDRDLRDPELLRDRARAESLDRRARHGPLARREPRPRREHLEEAGRPWSDPLEEDDEPRVSSSIEESQADADRLAVPRREDPLGARRLVAAHAELREDRLEPG